MRRIFLSLFIFLSLAASSQTCDTVTNIVVNATSTGFTATWTAGANAILYSLSVWTHPANVNVPFSSNTTSNTTFSISGILQPNTQYRLEVASICAGPVPRSTSKVFTTTSGQAVCTPMTAACYSFKYVRVDSMLHVAAGDTALRRADTRAGAITYKTSDSTFYGWNGVKWGALGSNASASLINQINGKVDTIFTNGDTLKWRKNNTVYGIYLPSVSNTLQDVLNAGNIATGVAIDIKDNYFINRTSARDEGIAIGAVNASEDFYVGQTFSGWSATIKFDSINGPKNYWFPRDSGMLTTLNSFSAVAPFTYNNSTGKFELPQSSSISSGWVSTTDWNTFNNKVSSSRTISTGYGLTGGGDLSANRTFIVDTSVIASKNYLSGYVPYTGATANLDMGTFSVTSPNFNSGGDNFFAVGGGSGNTGSFVFSFGANSCFNNSGGSIFAAGEDAGAYNSYNNVCLLGRSAQADEDGQLVHSKDGIILARFSTSLLTGTRKWNLPDANGTFALTSDLSSYFPLSGGTLTGTGGAGFIGYPSQSSAPSTPASGFRIFARSNNAFAWMGANGFWREFDGTSNTANRTYRIPDRNVTMDSLTTSTQMGLGNGQVLFQSGGLLRGSNNFFYDSTNARIGLSTSNPQGKFDARSGVAGRNVFMYSGISRTNTSGDGGYWDFYTNTAVTPDYFGGLGFRFFGGTNTAAKQFAIFVDNITTPRVVVTGNGRMGIGTESPTTSSLLDVSSTTNGSMPFPRMTSAQRTAISVGASQVGLHVYQTDGTEGVYVYKSTGWAFAY